MSGLRRPPALKRPARRPARASRGAAAPGAAPAQPAPSPCASPESAAAFLCAALGAGDGARLVHLARVFADHLREERRPTAAELRRVVRGAEGLARSIGALRGTTLRPYLEALLRETGVHLEVLAEALRERRPARGRVTRASVVEEIAADARVGFAALLRGYADPHVIERLAPVHLLAAAVGAGIQRPRPPDQEPRLRARWERIAARSERLWEELAAFERRRQERALIRLAHADVVRAHRVALTRP